MDLVHKINVRLHGSPKKERVVEVVISETDGLIQIRGSAGDVLGQEINITKIINKDYKSFDEMLDEGFHGPYECNHEGCYSEKEYHDMVKDAAETERNVILDLLGDLEYLCDHDQNFTLFDKAAIKKFYEKAKEKIDAR